MQLYPADHLRTQIAIQFVYDFFMENTSTYVYLSWKISNAW